MEVSDTGPAANTEILRMVEANDLSFTAAKDVRLLIAEDGPTNDPQRVLTVVEARGLKQVTDTGAIEQTVDEIIAANPDKVEGVKAKPAMLGWFVGQVMMASGGKANPQAVNEILRQKLGLQE
jgi:aspartyl-tRNA(Asn)/glutamyl-tRNA(Gln) amidotransferase subunit B